MPTSATAKGRPRVLLNAALTSNGSMTQASCRAISCRADWRRVHELREQVDAVAVGRVTWEQDRPKLTCRLERLGRAPSRQPARVVFAGSHSVEPLTGSSELFVVGEHRPTGVTCWVPTVGHDLAVPLAALFDRGVNRLLVEGGMTLLRSFVQQKLVDEATVYVATRHLEQARVVVEDTLPGLPPFLGAVPLGEGTLVICSVDPEGTVVRQDFRLPASDGTWQASVFRVAGICGDHVAQWLGELQGPAPLVRLHSACFTGDVFGSTRCDCGAQLRTARRRVRAAGRGLILYMPQEGRGVGLLAKACAYGMQDGHGLDTLQANVALGLPADARRYTAAARILRELGISSVRLLTNNRDKISGLQQAGIEVVQRVPLRTRPRAENSRYLATKVARMGHYQDLISL